MKYLIISLIFVLTGCKVDDFNDTGELSIDDFYITGSIDSSEIPQIDPYQNDGEFFIYIKTGKPDLGFELSYYLSNKRSTLDSAATRIYRIECDDDDQYCYDGDYYGIECQFNPDLAGHCAGKSFDLSSSIYTLPFSGYILAELCHRVQNQCVVSSQRVIVR